jgi:chloramphenicol-sensitive protein RarD
LNANQSRPLREGLFYGMAAYTWWGLIPLYFKFLEAVPPLEMLAHRVVWSFVVLAVVALVSRRWAMLVRAVSSPRTAATLVLTAVLIAINWATYIYAVSHGQVVQASMGYFLTPLMNVLLGMLILGERLRRLQWVGVALAVAGVVCLATSAGEVPYIALLLAVSFGFYALLRKTVRAEATVGLLFETALVAPLAAGYLLWLEARGVPTWNNLPQPHLLVLIASGVVTTTPLLLFVMAARRLPLTTMGFLQYLSPTLQFLLAVLAFEEPFGRAEWISFAWIWAAVSVYLADSIYARQRSRIQSPLAADQPAACEQAESADNVELAERLGGACRSTVS